MIDVRQLRYFVAVCDQLHFTKAADTLSVAQSAQIKRLENDLGVRLIERGKRSAARLTDAGTMFLIEARQSLLQIERAERIGRLAARGVVGTIDLGHIASAVVDGTLPAILGTYRAGHPQVAVNLFHMETPVQLRALSDGRIDVAFIRPRAEYPVGVSMRTIGTAPLMVAVPMASPLAVLDKVPVSSLSGQNFVIPQFDEGASYAKQLERLGELLDAPIPSPIRVGDFFSTLALVGAGYGVALIPGFYDQVRIESVAIRPLTGFDEVASLMLAWRSSDPSPALAAFVATALARGAHQG